MGRVARVGWLGWRGAPNAALRPGSAMGRRVEPFPGPGLRAPIHHLDSVFKSRDITLPTKVRLVKAMVFPVVMYGGESWTIKKVECQRIDAFEL